MEMILRWRTPIVIVVPWERLIRACLSMVLVCVLYCCMRTCTTGYGNETQEIKVSNMAVLPGRCRELSDTCGDMRNASKNPLVQKSEKNIELKTAQKRETAEVTSTIEELHITETAAMTEKSNTTKELLQDDLQKTEPLPQIIEESEEQESAAISESEDIPFVDENKISIEESESLREIAGFFVDGEGYITGITDRLDLLDGVLVLPVDEKCIGVRSGALSDIREDVMEIYIPANIFHIEEEAFADFITLMYIEVSEENSYYCSIEGILYSKSGDIIVCPG